MRHAAKIPTVADRLADFAASIVGVRPDMVQTDAEKFVEQMSAFGIDEQTQGEYLSATAMLAALGRSPRVIQVLAKSAATGRLTAEDSAVLRLHGINVSHGACDEVQHARERHALATIRRLAAVYPAYGRDDDLAMQIYGIASEALK